MLYKGGVIILFVDIESEVFCRFFRRIKITNTMINKTRNIPNIIVISILIIDEFVSFDVGRAVGGGTAKENLELLILNINSYLSIELRCNHLNIHIPIVLVYNAHFPILHNRYKNSSDLIKTNNLFESPPRFQVVYRIDLLYNRSQNIFSGDFMS